MTNEITRRGVIKSAGTALAVASMAGAAIKSCQADASQPDPVLPLFEEWKSGAVAVEAAGEEVSRAWDSLPEWCRGGLSLNKEHIEREARELRSVFFLHNGPEWSAEDRAEMKRRHEVSIRLSESYRTEALREFEKMEATWKATRDRSGLHEAERRADELSGHLHDLEKRIQETAATTPAGIAAKLRVALGQNGEGGWGHEDLDCPYVLSALRDAERLAGMG
jgi:hypothetical protein